MNDILPYVCMSVIALVAILGLFVSKPQNQKTALAIVGLILLATGIQFRDKLDADAKSKLVSTRIQTEVGYRVARVCSALHNMACFGSSDWVPTTEEEFFSMRTAEILAHHVDLEKDGSVIPKEAWRSYISRLMRDLTNKLEEAIVQNGGTLDGQLSKTMDECLNSKTLSTLFPSSKGLYDEAARQQGKKIPSPVWLPFHQGPEMLYEDMMRIRRLIAELRKAKGDSSWLPFDGARVMESARGSHRIESPSLSKLTWNP